MVVSAAKSVTIAALTAAYTRAWQHAVCLQLESQGQRSQDDPMRNKDAVRLDAASVVRDLLKGLYDQAVDKASDCVWAHTEFDIDVRLTVPRLQPPL